MFRRAELGVQVIQKESQLQHTQAEKSHLSTQVETWQRTTQEVQAKLEATQSEKEWVKPQLNSWKQTGRNADRIGAIALKTETSQIRIRAIDPKSDKVIN